MTSTVEHRPLLSEPFVVYFCAAPLLAEAVRTALEGIAEVRWLPAGRPGLSGLLHSLDPDAVVVDSDADADDAAAFADKAGVTLLHIGLGRPALRLRRHGCWHGSVPLPGSN